MRRIQFRHVSWLALLGLIFTLMAVPAAVAQGGKGKAAAPAAKAAAPAAKVDINNATEKELEDLPGVGAATAKKMIAGRPYKSVDELSKAGLSASKISKLTPLVTTGPAASAAPSAAPAAASVPSSDQTALKGKAAAQGKTQAKEEVAFQPPPSKGMVWVNEKSKVFHREGDRWYGNTKEGKYMTEADALKAGYREAKPAGKSKPNQ